jgi:hypothetical protein
VTYSLGMKTRFLQGKEVGQREVKGSRHFGQYLFECTVDQ